MEWTESGFGERFERALAATGKTQKSLCAEIGVNETTLSAWKKSNQPSYADVHLLAAALQVKPCYLFFGDEYEPMDDEELDTVEVLRKLNQPERASLQAFLKTTTEGRPATKKPGQRTKRAKPSAAPTVKQTVVNVPRPKLTEAEHDELMKYVVKLTHKTSKKRELPLIVALRKLSPLLSELGPSPERPDTAPRTSSASDTAAPGEASGAVQTQPDAVRQS